MNDHACLDAASFHVHLGELLRKEFAALGAFLTSLAEFDRRLLFRQLGYASLFDYLHKGLRLSRGAAHHRRAGAWLVAKFPEVLVPIEDGRLCFSTVAVVASVITEVNREEVLPRFYGLSKQEALEVAAVIEPRKVVPTRTVVTVHAPVLAPAPESKSDGSPLVPQEVALGTARHELATPSWTEDRQKVHPGESGAAPEHRSTIVPMTATESRLHVTVTRKFLALLAKARAGESHRNPGATDEEVLTLALIERQAKRKSSVPARVKREVLKRDEGKCTWPLADGGACGATVMLEIDHIQPRGMGGPSTVENCRLVCRRHNLEAARQAYGDEKMDLFTRRDGGGGVAREAVAGYGMSEGRGGEGATAGPPPTAGNSWRGAGLSIVTAPRTRARYGSRPPPPRSRSCSPRTST